MLAAAPLNIKEVGFKMPPAGEKMAGPACQPAGASCGWRLHPPELLLSCRADRPAAADRRAAASPAHPRRTLDIASALRCPDMHTGNTFRLIWFVWVTQQVTRGEISVKPLNAFLNKWCEHLPESSIRAYIIWIWRGSGLQFVCLGFIFTHTLLLSYINGNFS